MKMKSNVTIAVLGGALLTTAMISPVMAASHIPTKMTCEEFVALDDVVKPKVVYWAEGFNKKGKPVNAVVDVDETDKLIPVIITECQEAPKESFWKKIKKHF
jgi:hypothetical protein